MKRTTIFIDEAVELDLRLMAQKRSQPVAAVVREALARYVTEHRRSAEDLPAFVGSDRSGQRDTAERHEEIVFQDLEPYTPDEAKAPKRRRHRFRR